MAQERNLKVDTARFSELMEQQRQRARAASAKDTMSITDTVSGQVLPETNRAGGMAGGISTGLPIICRAVVKPTASIGQVQKSVDAAGKPVDLRIEGRHDPCIVIRIVPVMEHMVNLVLLDLYLAQTAIQGWA